MKKLLSGLVVVWLSVSVVGCNDDGPAEKTGEKIDNTVERVKDKIENKGPAEKAGEHIDETLNNS